MRPINRFNSFGRFASISLGIAVGFAMFLFTGMAKAQYLTSVEAPTDTRIIRAVSTTAAPGGHATVSVEMESLGNETATGFTLSFDQFKLSNPIVTLGSGAAGFSLTVNDRLASSGKLGVIVDAGFAFTVSPPARQIVSISFDVAPNATGTSPLTFSGSLIGLSTSDYEGNSLPVTYENGVVNFAASPPATISITGTVRSPTGQGISNANVVLSNAAGDKQTARTNPFGTYTFNTVPAGVLYNVAVFARRYQFQSVFVQPTDNLTGLDFEGVN